MANIGDVFKEETKKAGAGPREQPSGSITVK